MSAEVNKVLVNMAENMKAYLDSKLATSNGQLEELNKKIDSIKPVDEKALADHIVAEVQKEVDGLSTETQQTIQKLITDYDNTVKSMEEVLQVAISTAEEEAAFRIEELTRKTVAITGEVDSTLEDAVSDLELFRDQAKEALQSFFEEHKALLDDKIAELNTPIDTDAVLASVNQKTDSAIEEVENKLEFVLADIAVAKADLISHRNEAEQDLVAFKAAQAEALVAKLAELQLPLDALASSVATSASNAIAQVETKLDASVAGLNVFKEETSVSISKFVTEQTEALQSKVTELQKPVDALLSDVSEKAAAAAAELETFKANTEATLLSLAAEQEQTATKALNAAVVLNNEQTKAAIADLESQLAAKIAEINASNADLTLKTSEIDALRAKTEASLAHLAEEQEKALATKVDSTLADVTSKAAGVLTQVETVSRDLTSFRDEAEQGLISFKAAQEQALAAKLVELQQPVDAALATLAEKTAEAIDLVTTKFDGASADLTSFKGETKADLVAFLDEAKSNIEAKFAELKPTLDTDALVAEVNEKTAAAIESVTVKLSAIDALVASVESQTEEQVAFIVEEIRNKSVVAADAVQTAIEDAQSDLELFKSETVAKLGEALADQISTLDDLAADFEARNEAFTLKLADFDLLKDEIAAKTEGLVSKTAEELAATLDSIKVQAEELKSNADVASTKAVADLDAAIAAAAESVEALVAKTADSLSATSAQALESTGQAVSAKLDTLAADFTNFEATANGLIETAVANATKSVAEGLDSVEKAKEALATLSAEVVATVKSDVDAAVKALEAHSETLIKDTSVTIDALAASSQEASAAQIDLVKAELSSFAALKEQFAGALSADLASNQVKLEEMKVEVSKHLEESTQKLQEVVETSQISVAELIESTKQAHSDAEDALAANAAELNTAVLESVANLDGVAKDYREGMELLLTKVKSNLDSRLEVIESRTESAIDSMKVREANVIKAVTHLVVQAKETLDAEATNTLEASQEIMFTELENTQKNLDALVIRSKFDIESAEQELAIKAETLTEIMLDAVAQVDDVSKFYKEGIELLLSKVKANLDTRLDVIDAKTESAIDAMKLREAALVKAITQVVVGASNTLDALVTEASTTTAEIRTVADDAVKTITDTGAAMVDAAVDSIGQIIVKAEEQVNSIEELTAEHRKAAENFSHAISNVKAQLVQEYDSEVLVKAGTYIHHKGDLYISTADTDAEPASSNKYIRIHHTAVHHKGYDATETYLRGDTCLSDRRSRFVALKDYPQGKPGASEDWRLFVPAIKGDTGEVGAKGDRGLSGKDGVSIVSISGNENGFAIEKSDGTTEAIEIQWDDVIAKAVLSVNDSYDMPIAQFSGLWDSNRSYPRGTIVQFKEGLHLARKDTTIGVSPAETPDSPRFTAAAVEWQTLISLSMVIPKIDVTGLASTAALTAMETKVSKLITDSVIGATDVLGFAKVAPANPTKGAQYIVQSIASGGFTAKENRIANYNGTSWDFTLPAHGEVRYSVEDSATFAFNSTTNAWVMKLNLPKIYNQDTLPTKGMYDGDILLGYGDGGVYCYSTANGWTLTTNIIKKANTTAPTAFTPGNLGDIYAQETAGNSVIFYVMTAKGWLGLRSHGSHVTSGLVAPATPEIGDIWVNTSTYGINSWDGFNWQRLGSGGTVITTWASANAYKAGDVVYDGQNMYLALRAVTSGGTPPRTNTASWKQIVGRFESFAVFTAYSKGMVVNYAEDPKLGGGLYYVNEDVLVTENKLPPVSTKFTRITGINSVQGSGTWANRPTTNLYAGFVYLPSDLPIALSWNGNLWEQWKGHPYEITHVEPTWQNIGVDNLTVGSVVIDNTTDKYYVKLEVPTSVNTLNPAKSTVYLALDKTYSNSDSYKGALVTRQAYARGSIVSEGDVYYIVHTAIGEGNMDGVSSLLQQNKLQQISESLYKGEFQRQRNYQIGDIVQAADQWYIVDQTIEKTNIYSAGQLATIDVLRKISGAGEGGSGSVTVGAVAPEHNEGAFWLDTSKSPVNTLWVSSANVWVSTHGEEESVTSEYYEEIYGQYTTTIDSFDPVITFNENITNYLSSYEVYADGVKIDPANVTVSVPATGTVSIKGYIEDNSKMELYARGTITGTGAPKGVYTELYATKTLTTTRTDPTIIFGIDIANYLDTLLVYIDGVKLHKSNITVADETQGSLTLTGTYAGSSVVELYAGGTVGATNKVYKRATAVQDITADTINPSLTFGIEIADTATIRVFINGVKVDNANVTVTAPASGAITITGMAAAGARVELFSYSTRDPVITKTTTGAATVLPMVGATTSLDGTSGSVPKPSAGDQFKVLRGDGSWYTIPVMGKATATDNGTEGLVPASVKGDQNKFLRADGTWVLSPAATLFKGAHTVGGITTPGNDGIVPAPTVAQRDMWLKGEGTWSEIPNFIGVNTGNVAAKTAAGLVPAPNAATDADKFLKGDGTWATVSAGSGGATYGVVSTSENGLVTKLPALQADRNVQFLKADGTWATPVGTTYSVMNNLTNGLVPATGANAGSTTKFLNAAGNWADVPTMIAAQSAAVAGTAGLVPAPATTDFGTNKFLKVDGTWATVTPASIPEYHVDFTNPNFPVVVPGLVPFNDHGGTLRGETTFLNADGLWAVPQRDDTKADIASPAFTGTPTITGATPAAATDSTAIATTAFVQANTPLWAAAAFGSKFSPVKAPTVSVNQFLCVDGSWRELPTFSDGNTTGTTLNIGLVPRAFAADATKFLNGAGKWETPAGGTASSVMEGSSATGATAKAGTSGLVPAGTAGTGGTHFLRADGTWAAPAGSAVMTGSNLVGATVAIGTSGLVPAGAANIGGTHFLRADATWAAIPGMTGASAAGATQASNGAAGFVPAPTAGTGLTHFLRADGTWATPPTATPDVLKANLAGGTTINNAQAFTGIHSVQDPADIAVSTGQIANTRWVRQALDTALANPIEFTNNSSGVVRMATAAEKTLVLKGNGTWGLPASAAGTGTGADVGKFLRADGTWAAATATVATYAGDTAGLVPAKGGAADAHVLAATGSWIAVATKAELDLKANLAGNSYTGNHNFTGATSVTAPTVDAAFNNTNVATTQFVQRHAPLFSGTGNGLVRKPASDFLAVRAQQFLNGNGEWVSAPTVDATGPVPKLPAAAADRVAQFLRADGTWQYIQSMSGPYADSQGNTFNGTSGLVPAPTYADRGKYLRADGTWVTPPGTGSGDVRTGAITVTNAISGTKLFVDNTVTINAEQFSAGDSFEIINTSTTGNVTISITGNNNPSSRISTSTGTIGTPQSGVHNRTLSAAGVVSVRFLTSKDCVIVGWGIS